MSNEMRNSENQPADALREMEDWCQSHSELTSEVSLARNVMEEMRQEARDTLTKGNTK